MKAQDIDAVDGDAFLNPVGEFLARQPRGREVAEVVLSLSYQNQAYMKTSGDNLQQSHGSIAAF